MNTTSGTDREPDGPGDIPFGYRFAVDTDGTPNVVDSEGRWDAFTLWLDDNKYPADTAERLEAIDDVVEGRRDSYQMWGNASGVVVDRTGFHASMSLPRMPKTPHLVGSVAELRLLLQMWAEHMDRIGWTDES